MKHATPLWKIAATIGGTGLTGAATWLNAQHVAASEGWNSPLVFAGIFVTLCAASAPPFAKRAAKTGQPLKAAMLWVFFALAIGFSLSASIARSSGYVAGKAATIEQANEAAKLAREAYEAVKRAVAAECMKRGPKCRELEAKADADRLALATAAPVRSTDPGAERIAAVLGINEGAIELYQPLLLPLGLELGGFIFIALGLAPAATRRNDDDIAKPVATDAKPVAKRSPMVATLMRDATATAKPKRGTAGYYLERLQREHPDLAAQVAAGALTVNAACIKVGYRKAPAKRSEWTKPAAYLKEPEKV